MFNKIYLNAKKTWLVELICILSTRFLPFLWVELYSCSRFWQEVQMNRKTYFFHRIETILIRLQSILYELPSHRTTPMNIGAHLLKPSFSKFSLNAFNVATYNLNFHNEIVLPSSSLVHVLPFNSFFSHFYWFRENMTNTSTRKTHRCQVFVQSIERDTHSIIICRRIIYFFFKFTPPPVRRDSRSIYKSEYNNWDHIRLREVKLRYRNSTDTFRRFNSSKMSKFTFVAVIDWNVHKIQSI